MKTVCDSKRTKIIALTLIDTLAVIALLVLLAALLLPCLAAAKHKSARIGCVNNIKEINLAFKIWEGDNSDKLPMQIYATNDVMMEAMANGNAYVLWQSMSNELGTPKILICPQDPEHIAAKSFTQGFGDTNISYFANVDASDIYPQMILDGDDDFLVNGAWVTPGILSLPHNSAVSWTKDRHLGAGNIGLADGSAMQLSSSGLRAALAGSGTNAVRLVIP